jgi:hypothetical protein
MSRKIRILVILPVIVVAIAGMLLLISSVGSRAKLKRYQAELRAKGEKLTFREVAIPPSTNAEQVASRAVFISPAEMSGTYVTNSFSRPAPVPSLLMEFVAPGRARVAWGGELWLTSDTGNSRTNTHLKAEWADFDRTNGALAGKLGKYKLALEHPTPDRGWDYQNIDPNIFLSNTGGPPMTIVRDRALAYGLVNAEIGELHRGNLAEALTDLRALTGMAQLYRNEPMLVHQMFRLNGIAGIGLRATWEALQAPGWKEEQLLVLQRDWEQVEVMEGAERAFLGERAIGPIFMESVRRAKGTNFWELLPFNNGGKVTKLISKTPLAQFWKDQVLPVTYKVTSLDADELLHLKYLSEFIDTARLIKAGRPWPEVSVINSNLWKRFEVELSGGGIHSYWASAVIVPNLGRALQSVVRMETLRRMGITAIALKRYELRQGHPPSTLAALVPEYLREVPIDLMSGKPLVYRCNEDSTFVLYSVGEDGKDDGGQSGIDLWSGPDAVWPVVAR